MTGFELSSARLAPVPGDGGWLCRLPWAVLWLPGRAESGISLISACSRANSPAELLGVIGSRLAEPGAEPWPPFAVVASRADDLVAVVHGPVRVTVEHPEVEELLYGGDEAGSWLNRLLRSVNAVRAGAPGARDDLTNLRDGVVRASGFALTHRLAGKLAGNEAAPPAEPRPDAAFQDARLPDADLTVVEARASQADLTVAEHYDARQSAEVVGSGPAGAGQTGRPAPLGRLTWDNGEMDQLPAPVLVGRDVGADEAVVAGHLGALVPRGQTDSMSRVHAELRRQGAGVAIVDRGSTNGTFLWDEQRGAWQRLVPGEPRELRNGAVIAFGERTATFEASR